MRWPVAALVIAGLAFSGALVAAQQPFVAEVQRGSRTDERTLTGRVINDRDEPQPKAVVYLKNTKSLAVKTYITEPDGSYRFPSLASNVDYEIYAEREGVRSGTKTLSGFDSRKDPNITLRLHSR